MGIEQIVPLLRHHRRAHSQHGGKLRIQPRVSQSACRELPQSLIGTQVCFELMGTRFANLPPGVELRRGELRIAFYGTEDFLQKVGAVVFALQTIGACTFQKQPGQALQGCQARRHSTLD